MQQQRNTSDSSDCCEGSAQRANLIVLAADNGRLGWGVVYYDPESDSADAKLPVELLKLLP
jgi:hypothetical protein